MTRALWLPDVLKAEGLKVGLVDGWESRGYDTFDGADPEGIMWHHTASSKTWGTHPALGICTYGRSDLAGPLCHVLTPRDGDPFDVYVVASGKANHAGLGGPWKTVPLDSGNSYIVGNEVENDGIGEVWTTALVDRVQRINAAVLKKIARDQEYMLGHKEWAPTRKTDPNPMDMNAKRIQLAGVLAGDTEEDENEMNANDRFDLAAKLAHCAELRASGALKVAGYADDRPLPTGPDDFEKNEATKYKGLAGAYGKATLS